MHSNLECHIRKLARERGLSLAELARRAGMSRQALYGIWQPGHYPSMGTIISLAGALEVHPLSLLHQIFPSGSLDPQGPSDPPVVSQSSSQQGVDRSAFIRDENYPDGCQLIAGNHFIKAWTLQNVGEHVWEDRYLVCQDSKVRIVSMENGEDIEIAESLIPDQRAVAIPRTLPDQSVTISVGFTVPSTPATVISYWKMAHADGTLCFAESRGVWVKVNVITPIGAAAVNCSTRSG